MGIAQQVGLTALEMSEWPLDKYVGATPFHKHPVEALLTVKYIWCL